MPEASHAERRALTRDQERHRGDRPDAGALRRRHQTETADGAAEQQPQGPDFERIQGSGEFVALRSRLRRFVFPMSLLFFAWYLAYVLLAAYAHDFMSTKLFGHVNIAMVFGILQFASTIAITVAYVRFANHRIDPQVEDIRVRAGVTE